MGHCAVNFHYVGGREAKYPGVHGLTSQGLREKLEWIGLRRTYVSLDDVGRAVTHNEALPNDACLVTFDDGLRCQVEHDLPELDSLGIPAAFFVMAGPFDGRAAVAHKIHYVRSRLGDERIMVMLDEMFAKGDLDIHPQDVNNNAARESYRYDTPETARLKYFFNYLLPDEIASSLTQQLLLEIGMKEQEFIDHYYMDADMVKDLAARGWVGSHAVSHRPLAVMPIEEAHEELVGSRQKLSAIADVEIAALSYPLGNAEAVNRIVAEAAVDAGYRIAWTMERAENEGLSDPLLFARIDAADIDMLDAGLGLRTRYAGAQARSVR